MSKIIINRHYLLHTVLFTTLKITLFAMLLPTPALASGTYSGGTGELTNPFRIAVASDIIEMSQHDEDWVKHFILIADINMNLAEPNTSPIALISPDPNTQSGYQGISFTGTFDGQNHTIENLTIDTAGVDYDYLGLFGKIEGSEAEVKNLILKNALITGADDSRYIGSLAGCNYSSVSKCFTSGSVTSGANCWYLGGLVGYNDGGSITDCSAISSVTSTTSANYLGGLVGWNEGPLNNCSASGPVTGGVQSSELGGLVGANQAGGIISISNCSASGPVEGGDESEHFGGLAGANAGNINNCSTIGSVTLGDNSIHLGGLVGTNGGNINNCCATGTVNGATGTDSLGGLVGQHYSGNIKDCYATGSVTGNDVLGGLVGFNFYGTIENCYSIGSVAGATGATNLGGLVGFKFSGSINKCYFLDTAGPINGYGTALDDDDMQSQTSFVDWYFVDETTPGSEGFWRMGFMAPGYPILSWQRDIPGDLTGYYGVDLADYAFLANFFADTNCDFSNKHCSGADINLSGEVSLPDPMLLLSHWLDGK